MTLLDLLRAYGNATLTLEAAVPPHLGSSSVKVLAGSTEMTLEIEDVKFNAGGGLTMVHEVPKSEEGRAWAGAPETCEACQ